jgi:CubicO group peptidase (beta-lactamase class C family)
MRPDAIFRIYSMTKPITSVGVMMLYEEGRFLLNDPVSRYLPELGRMTVGSERTDSDTGKRVLDTAPAQRPIRIRDLLRHTAGFSYGGGPSAIDRLYREAGLRRQPSIEDFVKKLGGIPLHFEPGTDWRYGHSTDVLGRLIEVASGMPLDEFFEERIFEPLGMIDTGFFVPEGERDRLAALYTRDARGALRLAPPTAARNYFVNPGLLMGGEGLASTAADYARFCQMILNGGELDGARLLGPKSIELMGRSHTAHLERGSRELELGPGAVYRGTGFGLGFAVVLDTGQSGELGSVGTISWGGAASTRFWIDPAEELFGVFMIQILPDRGVRYGNEVRTLAYQSIVD